MEDSFFKYKNKLTNFFKNPTNENLKILNTNVFSKINWLLSETEIDYIVEEIKNENFKDYYNLYEKEKIVMTIHISKGLQFDNILIHKKDFYNRRGELEKEKFYVACTRAKKSHAPSRSCLFQACQPCRSRCRCAALGHIETNLLR